MVNRLFIPLIVILSYWALGSAAYASAAATLSVEPDPVFVDVIDNNPPQQNSSPRDSFIELSADKDTVYVQEQLVLSVKLFFNGNLIGGELSEPAHPNAIIESLGKQTEYSRFRDGTRYRVVERRYAIFPQQPGELSLPALRFEGQTRDASGRLKFLRDSKQLFTVPVKDVPEGFTGDTWLPATDLTLSGTGLPADASLNTGQNLSRSLSVVAEGLPAETLPPFSHDMPPGMRAYPDNPERTTTPSENGLTARLTQATALVPVEGGELVLPEIQIPWWDTDTDSQKVARIEARAFNVQATNGQPATTEGEAENPQPAEQTVPAPAENNAGAQPVSASSGVWLWQTLTIVLLIGWTATGFGWWYSRRSGASPAAAGQAPDVTEKALFNTLCESARAGAPETADHLIRWLQHRHPQRPVVSLSEAYGLLKNTDVIARETEKLQARAFSQQSGAAESWDGEKLVNALEKSRAGMAKKPGPQSPLPPLFPDELNAGAGRHLYRQK
jgi:hypothetical protein